ncbi:hypothetical protein MNB_SUP05-5-52 [hydrothermal vent metagenome]|uniref:Glycosyltransferase RgtA/B/C/D-like domain-containing protein n=1 Tax=hydrothermal vent metagenome TaxID=652676 RepID=A0A1W1CFT1_9ZZZZ
MNLIAKIKTISSQTVLLWFVLSLAFLLTGYKALELGKFGDGEVYNSLARNMADGFGSFWQPYFSESVFNVFYEHPPFIIFLKSLLFTFFGDSIYFEGVYALFIGSILLLLMARLWHLTNISYIGVWWVLLLIVAIPYFTYALDTGLLVVTFSAFFLSSVILSYKSQFKTNYYLFSIYAAIFIYLGFISKGPVALATLALPTIAFITLKTKFITAIKTTLIMIITFILLLSATLYFSEDAQIFWQNFWSSQVLTSLSGTRGITNYWQLPEHFINEIISPIIIIGFISLFQWKLKLSKSPYFWFFLLLAIASSFPFFLSPRQNNHYIFHSWFLFILALAHLTTPIAKNSQKILKQKPKLKIIYFFLTIFLIITTFYLMIDRKDKLGRRADFFADFYLQNIQIKPRSMVTYCPYDRLTKGSSDVKIFPSLQRVYKASYTKKTNAPYLIIEKNKGCVIPDNYFLVHTNPTRRYLLYKRKYNANLNYTPKQLKNARKI